MWSNNGSQDHTRRSSPSSHPDEAPSPEYSAAAALARRMVYPAYDHVGAGPAYYEHDAMPWSQHRQQHPRAREMEFLHLQHQMQEMHGQHAFVEEEAARRSRLMELELSVNHMQEYDRVRMQVEMMRNMQHHEALAEVDRGRLLVGHPYSGMDSTVRQHQIAEYLAGQRSRAVEDDAEAWRTTSSSSHPQQSLPAVASIAPRDDETFLVNSYRKVPASGTNEIDLKKKNDEPAEKKKKSPTSDNKKQKTNDKSGDNSTAALKRKSPDSPKKKASSDAPKKKKPNHGKNIQPSKMKNEDSAKVTKDLNAGAKNDVKVDYPTPAVPPDQEKPTTPNEAASSNKTDSPDTEQKQTPTKTVVTAPIQHASKTLAHLKSLQENSAAKQSTPSKSDASKSSATSKKRKKTPSAKKMDSLASLPDKPSSGSKAKSKKSPGGNSTSSGGKIKLQPPRPMTNHISLKRAPGVPSVDDPAPPITEVQYENVVGLMTEFCRVPFLAEFSRPVSLLHPELMTQYSKIVHHSMDLGHVCRAIRRREYRNTRSIQLDMWRIFSNCVKFHTHPSNRDNAIPSFISIANHLRDFFNNLWQEFMMSSDAPPRQPGKGISHVHSAYQKRAEARKERLLQISSTVLSPKCMRKVADALENFISSGGRVDKLDKDGILGNVNHSTGDVATFIQSLREVIGMIEMRIENSEEYTVGALHRDLKKSYTEEVFATDVLKRMRIGSRLDRLMGKILVPVHEVNCRGVNQSSIWGNMAAMIWARESKKKPYWPAIVLGMMAPEDQKEDWHEFLTERNEARLPEKLREELQLGKRRAEQALKKQSSDPMSYFLVEFMGSHEFIWVRESDIKENFDPEVDPNVAAAAGNVTKKRRSGHSSINTKIMSDAIEEGRWALEEFEILLNDTCGDHSDDESEYDDAGYTYDIMCQSDDEADELNASGPHKDNDSDIEEQNELLVSNGCLDFSVEGRKKAKARSIELKKQKALLIKQEKSKEAKAKKDAATKKAIIKKPSVTEDDTKQLAKQLEEEEMREKREIEARRKKRSRDHERSLKEMEKKSKKTRLSTPEKRTNPNAIPDKKARAEAFIKSFLIHKCKTHSDFTGASFVPTNSVDPSSLLGMALAFRGAAGDIPFDNNGKDFIENPWDKIDACNPKESSQRCNLLQEQIDLVEKEIQKVNAAKESRYKLYSEAKKSLAVTYKTILDAGDRAKSAKTSTKKKKKNSMAKAETIKTHDDIDDMSGRTPIDCGLESSAVSTPDDKPRTAQREMAVSLRHAEVEDTPPKIQKSNENATSMTENRAHVTPSKVDGDIADNAQQATSANVEQLSNANFTVESTPERQLFKSSLEAPDLITTGDIDKSLHVGIPINTTNSM